MTHTGKGRWWKAKALSTGETFNDPPPVSGIWHAMEHKTSENTKLDTDVFKLEQKWHKLGLDETEENPEQTCYI